MRKRMHRLDWILLTVALTMLGIIVALIRSLPWRFL